jgi:sortase A
MRRHLGILLIAAGLVVMAWPVVTWAYGIYWQERLASDLQRIHTEALPGETAAPVTSAVLQQAVPRSARSTAAVANGSAFVRLWIKRIDLDALVVEGDDSLSLRRGPGHLPATGYPGENRNCVIAAHRDGWFRRLHEVKTGDPVWLESRDHLFKYTVEDKQIVLPNRADLLDQGTNPILTLVTCTGANYPHSKYRLLVFCRLQGIYPRNEAQ